VYTSCREVQIVASEKLALKPIRLKQDIRPISARSKPVARSAGASGSRGYGAVRIKNSCKKEIEVSELRAEFKDC
jgi:CRISPR/Cas system CSM-associated protein Csm3 (group 7 of RAMP superfamily)